MQSSENGHTCGENLFDIFRFRSVDVMLPSDVEVVRLARWSFELAIPHHIACVSLASKQNRGSKERAYHNNLQNP